MREKEGRGKEGRKEQPSRNVTNSIHEAAGSNLELRKQLASPSIPKKIWAVICMYIARGCETRADLISNSVTRAEFDYVGSLTLHNARGRLTVTCIRFSRKRKCRIHGINFISTM